MFPKLSMFDGISHEESVLRIMDSLNGFDVNVQPFKTSKWKKMMDTYIDTSNDRGYLQRATFMSGGVLHTSFDVYKESMHVLADDILNKVVLPINEIAHNVEKVRLNTNENIFIEKIAE